MGKMKLEKLNTWLTFVANVGVVIGLIFLVAEMRQSNHQAAAATAFQRVSDIDAANREIALSESLVEIYVKTRDEGLSTLTPVEYERLKFWENARKNRMQGQLDQYHRGYIDQSAYEDLIGGALGNLPLWKELGFENEFIQYIESTMIESGEAAEEE